MEYGTWRRRYLPLYLQKISAASLSNQNLMALTALEGEMPIDVITICRSIAEDQMTSVSSEVSRQSSQSGWMTQGLMQFMQLLHPSSKTDPLLLESADEDIKRIYSAFDADEKSIDQAAFHGLTIELQLEMFQMSIHDCLSPLMTVIGQQITMDVESNGEQTICKMDINEINMIDATSHSSLPILKMAPSDHPGCSATIETSPTVIEMDVYGLQLYPRIKLMQRLKCMMGQLPNASLKHWIRNSGAMLSTKRARILSQMPSPSVIDVVVLRLHDPSIIIESSDGTSSAAIHAQTVDVKQKQKEEDVTFEMGTVLNDAAFESTLVEQVVYSKWAASMTGLTVSLQSPHQAPMIVMEPFSVSGNISVNPSIVEASLPMVISDWRASQLSMNASQTAITTLKSMMDDAETVLSRAVDDRSIYDGPKCLNLQLTVHSGRVLVELNPIVSTAVDRFSVDRTLDISVSYPRLKINFEDDQSGNSCILTTQIGAVHLKASQLHASCDVTVQSIQLQDSRQPDSMVVLNGFPFFGRLLMTKELKITFRRNDDHYHTELDFVGIEVNGYPNESGGDVHSNRQTGILSLCVETYKDGSELKVHLKNLAIGSTFLMRLMKPFMSTEPHNQTMFDTRHIPIINRISQFHLLISESYFMFPLEISRPDAPHIANMMVYIPELSLKSTTVKLWMREIGESMKWTEIEEVSVKNSVVLMPSQRDDREQFLPLFSLPEFDIINDSHHRLSSLSPGDILSSRDIHQRIHGSMMTASIDTECLKSLLDVQSLFQNRLRQFFSMDDASKPKKTRLDVIQWTSSTAVNLDGVQLWMIHMQDDRMDAFRLDFMKLVTSINRSPNWLTASMSWADIGIRQSKHCRQEAHFMKSDGLYTPMMMTEMATDQGDALLGSKESMDEDENGSVSSSTSWQTAGSQLSNARRFGHSPQTSSDFESVEEGSLYVSGDTHRTMPSLSEVDSVPSPRTEAEELTMHPSEASDNDLDLVVCGAWLISEDTIQCSVTNSNATIQMPNLNIAVNLHSIENLLTMWVSYIQALMPAVPVCTTRTERKPKLHFDFMDLHLIVCDVPKLSEASLKDEGPRLQTEIHVKSASIQIDTLHVELDVSAISIEPSWMTCLDPRTLRMEELRNLGCLLSTHGLRCSMQYPRSDIPNGPHNMLDARIEADDMKLNISFQRSKPIIASASRMSDLISLLSHRNPENNTTRMHPVFILKQHHCCLVFSLQRVSASVVDDAHDLAFPIAEGMLTDIQATAESLVQSDIVAWDLHVKPALQLYNRCGRGWEELMNGPHCDVQGKVSIIQSMQPSDRTLSFMAVRMEMSSPIEISLTPEMIQSLIGLSTFPKSLKECMTRPEEVPFVSFWIQNETGSHLECSIEGTDPSLKIPIGSAECRPVHVPTIPLMIPHDSIRRTSLAMSDFQGDAIDAYETGAQALMDRSDIELIFCLSEQSIPCDPLRLVDRGIRRFTVEIDPSMKTTTLVCRVDTNKRGLEVTLHSEIQLENRTAYRLEVGCWREGALDPQIVMLETSTSFWIPVSVVAHGHIAMRPSPPAEHRYALRCTWSRSVELDSIPKGRSRSRVKCDPVSGGLKSIWLYLAAHRSEGYGASTIVVHAPVALHNFLPVPLDIAVSCDEGKTTSLRGKLDPLTSVQGYTIHGPDIANLRLIPIGYLSKDIPTRKLDVALPSTNQFEATVDDIMAEEKTVSIADGTVPLRLCRRIEGTSGTHILEVSCSLWIFNCTGHRLALREPQQDAEDTPTTIEDSVPDRWVVPYAESAPTGRSPSASAVGLQSLLEEGQPERFRLHTGSAPTVGMTSGGSSSHASMNILGHSHRPSRLCLRMSGSRAPIGRDYWSEALSVEDDGVTVVRCLNPMHATSTSPPFPDAAYFLAVSTIQIPNSLGARALHIQPRYILRNASRFAFQYRQQGIQLERELPVDVSRHLHWPDANAPLLIGMRIQEAGWMWSGGLRMDTPGDTMIKLRHRVREETILMQFDVTLRSDGVLVAILSHQSSGFTPYRLDNFTREKLHVRQMGVIGQEDILRPYASMPYAWDEPSGQHRIVLEGTARASIGIFSLDTIGETTRVRLLPETNDPYCNRVRHLKITIKAEGPTRVLSVVDEDVHPNIQMPESTLPMVSSSVGRFAPVGSRNGIEIQISLTVLGVSLVSNDREMLYARLKAPFVELKQTDVKWEARMSLTGVQLDACLQSATHPVLVYGPISPEVWTGWMGSSSTALDIQLSIWRRRPGGVICIERCSIHGDPFALNVEERTIRTLAAFMKELLPSMAPSTPPNDMPRVMTPADDEKTMVQSTKIYLEELSVSQCQVRISFTPDAVGEASQGSFLKNIVSLATFEGAQIILRPLKLKHPLLSIRALLAVIGQHYTASLLPQLYKIVGSADILGDPVHLLHRLGLGVWLLFANPTHALVQSKAMEPLGVLRGLASGVSSLIENVLVGIADALTKMSQSSRRGLLLAFHLEVSLVNDVDLLRVILEGLVGILSGAASGLDADGLMGFCRGGIGGITASIVRPIASTLKIISDIAEGISRFILGRRSLDPLRLPRHVIAGRLLHPYDALMSIGAAILDSLQETPKANALQCCFGAEEPDLYFLIAGRCLISARCSLMHPPASVLICRIALEDVECIRLKGRSVIVFGCVPLCPWERRTVAETAGPFFVETLDCLNVSTACRLSVMLHVVCEKTPKRTVKAGNNYAMNSM